MLGWLFLLPLIILLNSYFKGINQNNGFYDYVKTIIKNKNYRYKIKLVLAVIILLFLIVIINVMKYYSSAEYKAKKILENDIGIKLQIKKAIFTDDILEVEGSIGILKKSYIKLRKNTQGKYDIVEE